MRVLPPIHIKSRPMAIGLKEQWQMGMFRRFSMDKEKWKDS